MPNVKGKTNGLKSSEFLVTVCGLILGLAMAIAEQVLGDGNAGWLSAIGGVIAAICGGSYNLSRAKVKAALAGAEAVAEVGKQEANSPKD